MTAIVPANAYSSLFSAFNRSLSSTPSSSSYLFDFPKFHNSAGSAVSKVEVQATTPGTLSVGSGQRLQFRLPNWGKLQGLTIKVALDITASGAVAGVDTENLAFNWFQRVSLDTARGTTIESLLQADIYAESLLKGRAARDKDLVLAKGLMVANGGPIPTAYVLVAATQKVGVAYVDIPFSCLANPMTYPDLASTEPMVLTIDMTGGGITTDGLAANGFGTTTLTASNSHFNVSVVAYMNVTSQSDRLLRQSIEFKSGVSTIPLLNRFPETVYTMTQLGGVGAEYFQNEIELRCRNSVKYSYVYAKRSSKSMAPAAILALSVSAGGQILWQSNFAESLLRHESADAVAAGVAAGASVAVIPWALIRSIMNKEQMVSCEGGIHLGSVPNPRINVRVQYTAAEVPVLYVSHAFYQASQFTTNASGLNFAWAITDVD